MLNKFAGDNQRIEYELINDDKEADFAIDSNNGTIFNIRLLDREKLPFYNLVAVAKDKAKYPQPRLSASVQVRFYYI